MIVDLSFAQTLRNAKQVIAKYDGMMPEEIEDAWEFDDLPYPSRASIAQAMGAPENKVSYFYSDEGTASVGDEVVEVGHLSDRNAFVVLVDEHDGMDAFHELFLLHFEPNDLIHARLTLRAAQRKIVATRVQVDGEEWPESPSVTRREIKGHR